MLTLLEHSYEKTYIIGLVVGLTARGGGSFRFEAAPPHSTKILLKETGRRKNIKGSWLSLSIPDVVPLCVYIAYWEYYAQGRDSAWWSLSRLRHQVKLREGAAAGAAAAGARQPRQLFLHHYGRYVSSIDYIFYSS